MQELISSVESWAEMVGKNLEEINGRFDCHRGEINRLKIREKDVKEETEKLKGFIVGAGHEAQVFKDRLDRMEENVCRCGRTPSEVGEKFVYSEDEGRMKLSYASVREDEYIAPPVENSLSQIRTLTSKITQVCQDICDIKLRRLLITQSEKEPNVITNSILTNQSDHKDTWGSDRSRPGTLDIHEGRAEGYIDYTYKTPNHHEHSNQDSLQHCDTYQLQWLPEPSGMTPEPLPFPDPSEASEMSSSLPAVRGTAWYSLATRGLVMGGGVGGGVGSMVCCNGYSNC